MSFWTLGCNKAHLLAGDHLRSKNEVKPIRMRFYHVPTETRLTKTQYIDYKVKFTSRG